MFFIKIGFYFVFVYFQNQRVPADMVFLRTTEKNGKKWTHFIEINITIGLFQKLEAPPSLKKKIWDLPGMNVILKKRKKKWKF